MAIRDFMYLDVQRLRSFASQVLPHGIPTASAKTETKSAEAGAEARGRIPLLIEGGANTKGVLSATSTVNAEVHHGLVEQVISGLREKNYLWPEADAAAAPDGSFVVIAGRIQIVDPDALRSVVARIPSIEHAVAVATDTGSSAPSRSRADKRAGRNVRHAGSSGFTKQKADAFGEILEFMTPGTVRMRFLRGSTTVATAVVERDKFVEDLDRLIRRHGYLTGSEWTALCQVNHPADAGLYQPGGDNLMDVLEGSVLNPMRTISELSGTSAGADLTVTPLAVYREIVARS